MIQMCWTVRAERRAAAGLGKGRHASWYVGGAAERVGVGVMIRAEGAGAGLATRENEAGLSLCCTMRGAFRPEERGVAGVLRGWSGSMYMSTTVWIDNA